jgi:hypothetical protein
MPSRILLVVSSARTYSGCHAANPPFLLVLSATFRRHENDQGDRDGRGKRFCRTTRLLRNRLPSEPQSRQQHKPTEATSGQLDTMLEDRRKPCSCCSLSGGRRPDGGVDVKAPQSRTLGQLTRIGRGRCRSGSPTGGATTRASFPAAVRASGQRAIFLGNIAHPWPRAWWLRAGVRCIQDQGSFPADVALPARTSCRTVFFAERQPPTLTPRGGPSVP